MALTEFFDTAQATRLARYRTPQMVDYLARTGIVTPSIRAKPGRGRRRLYTFGDVVLLRAVNVLLSAGLSVAKLKIALDTVRSKFRNLTPEQAMSRFLITDGQKVLLEDETHALIDLTADGQLVFAFVVDVEAARQDVIRAASGE